MSNSQPFRIFFVGNFPHCRFPEWSEASVVQGTVAPETQQSTVLYSGLNKATPSP